MLETTDIVVVGLRALAFIAVLQAAGSALYGAVFPGHFSDSRSSHNALTFAVALSAIALVIGHHVSEPARMTASFSGIRDGYLHLILLQSDAGAARVLRILGLATIASGALIGREHRGNLMLVGGVLTLCSFMLMGHTASHPQRWLLSILLLIHLLVAAFWFGALSAFIVAAKQETPSAFGAAVRDFSVIAGWLVPAIPIAGLVIAFVLMPDIASLNTSYGRLLIGKALVFSFLMALAAWNKFRLVPALVEEKHGALVQFQRLVVVEWLAIALVLGMTAAMTGLFGPE